MSGKQFFDTNIFVYAYDKSHPTKNDLAQQLILKALEEDSLVISPQVLSEFFVTVTQKAKKKLAVSAVRKAIESFRIAEVVALNFEHVATAMEIHDKKCVSYWDALIIATAQAAQCAWLITEDLNDGQRFGTLRVKNPFL